ncbi:hypothetical protein DXA26_15005 [Bacteroides fragilis]|nr:hypothetical protein DXB33_16005 [Bacteroides fragilis]RGO60118.1 hypothetical protein DXB09_13125 [Bacteroides fragilis]RGY72956.1 hypothetical protein DXA26_15005 [Bacteroides fragilis]
MVTPFFVYPYCFSVKVKNRTPFSGLLEEVKLAAKSSGCPICPFLNRGCVSRIF